MENDPEAKLDLPPGITQEMLEAHEARQRARAMAHAKPLPGPLGPAFAGQPPRLGPLVLRDVTLDDFCILWALGNPFADGLDLVMRGQEWSPDIGIQHLLEVLYLWSHPSAHCRGLVDQGPDAFRQATRGMETGLDLHDLPRIFTTILDLLRRSISTQVEHGPPATPGQENFTTKPGSQGTASAGGSTSSAPS